jgi:hypothetical protein
MTAFAYTPIMAGHHFDPYSTDGYTNFAAPTQSYPTTTFSMDSSFPAALTPIDSFPALHPYSEAPRSQESYQFAVDSSAAELKSTHPYSPAASPMEHMPPPQLSASSESGASVHSTSSSAMGSPHMNPSYPADEWTAIPGHGLGAFSHGAFHQPYFTTSIEQDALLANNDKLPGFVGESTASLHSSPHYTSPITPLSATFQPSASPTATFTPADAGQQLPNVPVLKSQTERGHSPSKAPSRKPGDEVFKTPVVPASAMLPPSPRRLSPPRTQQADGRRRSSLPGDRRNSLLSHQVFPPSTTPLDSPSSSLVNSPQSYNSPIFTQGGQVSLAPVQSSCSFPAPATFFSLSFCLTTFKKSA